jgi:DNA-binding NarL/FixJ family response regulator
MDFLMRIIRVVVVDNHPVFRAGMRSVLLQEKDIQIVGEADTAENALQMVEELHPDILLLDLKLPDRSGLEVVEELNRNKSQVQVIIVSVFDDLQTVKRLVNCNVSGYLLKEEAARLVIDTVRAAVYQGVRGYSAAILSELSRTERAELVIQNLSPRELEVLRLVAKGETNNGIGYALKISPKTVEKHLGSIFHKLQVNSRTEAAIVAVRKNILL